MSKPILSILTCTLECRKHWLERMMGFFAPQLTDDVQIITDCDNGEVTIGEKRNRLMQKADTEFIAFFDDDDEPHPQYVSLIVEQLKRADIDCVGFKMQHWLDDYHANGIILSFNHGQVVSDPMVCYMRHIPNHINPTRRSIAIQVPFLDSNQGEDTRWAYDLFKHCRATEQTIRESFIDEYLYLYRYRRNREGEVTNRSRTGKSRCDTESKRVELASRFEAMKLTTPTSTS